MSEIKYHTSKSGFLTKCTAEKRACPRGSQHYTQSEYEKLVSENDVRVRPQPSKATNKIAKDKDGYYYKAEQDYIEAMKGADNYKKADAIREKEKAKLFRANGLKESDEQKYIAERQARVTSMTNYARKIYKEEGVSDYRASVITDKMHSSKNPDRPLKKRDDPRDPDILEKTTRAVDRLKADPEFAKLKKAYNVAASKLVTMEKIRHSTYESFSARISENGGDKGNNWGFPHEKRIEAYKEAKAWLAAGVPTSANKAYLPNLTPNEISVGKDGKINNAWVEHKDGRVERIVGYNPPTTKSSGHLVTESGKEVNMVTHYHSYTKTVSGHQHIIVGTKNGDSYPTTEAFYLQGSWDSGD